MQITPEGVSHANATQGVEGIEGIEDCNVVDCNLVDCNVVSCKKWETHFPSATSEVITGLVTAVTTEG